MLGSVSIFSNEVQISLQAISADVNLNDNT